MQYFEDLTAGDSYESHGRTVTKTEMIDFASRFDPQPFHIDEEAARDSIFGELIASGIHTFGICQRLATEAFFADTAFLVGRGVDGLRFPKPTYPGDTISATVTVLDKRADEGGQPGGHVDVGIEGFNQNGQRVAGWTALAIIAHRNPD